MSEKQSVLDAVQRLPETATWVEITDTLLSIVAREGSSADFARLYRAHFTADQLAAYLQPQAEIPLDSVIAELESQTPSRASA
jgi:hypothetical protein